MSSRALGFCVMGSGRTEAGEASSRVQGEAPSRSLEASQATCVSFAQAAASSSPARVPSCPAVALSLRRMFVWCLVPGVLQEAEGASPHPLPAHQGPPPFKYPPVRRSLRETALRAAQLSLSKHLLPELRSPPRLCAIRLLLLQP